MAQRQIERNKKEQESAEAFQETKNADKVADRKKKEQESAEFISGLKNP